MGPGASRRVGWGFVALAAVAAPARASVPVQTSVAIDGNLADWTQVLTSPPNVGLDGDGTSFGCFGSTDRDCPVTLADVDLGRMAWTWNDTDLFVYLERYGTGALDDYAWVYIDVDDDGLLGASDFVAAITVPANQTVGGFGLYQYVPQRGSGDPLTDAAGFADGYDMPGSLGAQCNGNCGAAMGAAPGARAWEVRVRWGKMGLAAGAPIRMHVSSGTTSVASLADDNMGATDGAAMRTAFTGVSVRPDRTLSAAPSGTLQIPHRISNAGNLTSVMTFQARSSTGHDLDLWRDANFDGVPETFLGHDAGGDGVLTLTGDSIAAAGDTDGDGVLDTGPLAMGASYQLYVIETFGAAEAGLQEQIDVSATVLGAPSSTDSATDTIRVGDVTIVANALRSGVAGDVAWVPHQVQDNTPSTLTIDLSAVSTRGWSWTFWSDPNADGDPTDAVQLVDTDGSGAPDVTLGPGQVVSIFARVLVPAGSPLGQQELAYIRAVLSGVPQSVVEDRVIVMTPMDLSPSYLLALGQARYGGAGGAIYFPHRLANHRGVTDGFLLSATADIGWPAVLLSDPDRDGRPYDAVPLPPGPVTLRANDGELAFFVRVDIPSGARLGDLARVSVTATSQSTPSLSRGVEDDAIAALIRVYADVARTVNVSSVDPCGTAYVSASGLQPATSGYRFTWRDPAGIGFRSLDVTTDASGSSQDAATLASSQSGPGWTVEIAQWDGVAWRPLDTAQFTIGDAWRLQGLATYKATYDARDSSLGASAVMANDAYDQPLDTSLRWVVLSPDGASYLDASGSFLPYSGSEATTVQPVRLQARQEALSFVVSGVAFPVLGTYRVEVWRTVGCRGEELAGATTFDVIDDPDGDGLATPVEVAAGTDPRDDDSDDDGLTDGRDGLGDSDADGAIDALDCDSDGDGLLDGVESGVFAPAAGTAPGSACYVPDAWPATTTDPDVADTDGGGVTDGAEDVNRDGRVDAGEGDPSVAADDLAFDGDGDTLPDVVESARGTDPLDADSDDDGRADGAEPDADTDGDTLPDALDCDSDGDGLPDGLESGIASAGAGTDVAAGCFVADADPSTTTDPRLADSDGGGIPDATEDRDANGRVDPGETDPALGSDDATLDRDADGLPDLSELARGTNPLDADSDDDGRADGAEPDADTDGDTLPDALDCDSDGDGLTDGLEAGVAAPGPGTDASAGCFIPDSDPSTTTDPARADTDGGGIADGIEDADRDGARDANEGDPNIASDDVSGCSFLPPAEIVALDASGSGGRALLAWSAPSDPCTSSTLLVSVRLPAFAVLASGLAGGSYADAVPGPLRCYLVRADSSVAGPGPAAP